MSLATNVTDLATRAGTEAKALRTLINGNVADLSALNTTAKSNVAAAINELAAALGDDPAFATTVTTALANRLRFDAAQTLTAPQQAQARTNIGAVSAVDVGDTASTFVTTFEAGLA